MARKGPAKASAASATPSSGPLSSDLRYSDLEQPSILRPVATTAAIGAGLVGTLGGMFAYKHLKPRLAQQVTNSAKWLAEAEQGVARNAPGSWTHDRYLEDVERWKRTLDQTKKRTKKELALGTGFGAATGGAAGGLVGIIPGFAYGMKREREYEDAIKLQGMQAYEKAAEVISGDPDENIIDTSTQHSKSRIGAGAALGAAALGIPTAILTHRAGSKSLAGLKKLRGVAAQAVDLLDQDTPGVRQGLGTLADQVSEHGGWRGRLADKLLRGPLPEKFPKKFTAAAGAATGAVGAGVGALAGHEYDHVESRAVGRTTEEVDVRGHRVRRVGAGIGAGLALGAAHQLIKARKGPPMLDLMDFVPSMARSMLRGKIPEHIKTTVPHPFPAEARALKAMGTGALGGAAGLGYDMGVRSGYDDQETEFDTNSGNRASPITIFNAASPVVPAVASSAIPLVPGVLKPSRKTLALGGGIGGLANMLGRIRGRKISETARAAEKNASVREYGRLFDAVSDGQLGEVPQAALEGIRSEVHSPLQKLAASDIFTDGMDDKSRRRRLAELLKRREATGTASGSASPNPPQDS